MAYSEMLVNKVREALCGLAKGIEEKKMFQGLTFMVDGKMCIGIRNEELMCRIGPNIFEEALERPGCRPMIHNNRVMRGYVFISEEGHRRQEDFDYWIKLVLEYNPHAKASARRKTNI